MATPIKAIPTLRGEEAREFRRKADEAERNFKGYENRDQHPFCQMANAILRKASLAVLLTFVSSAFAQNSTSSRVISKEQTISDIDSLVYVISEVHPDMFGMCGMEAFMDKKNAIINTLPDSVSSISFYERVAPLVTMIGDGHTSLWYPYNDVFTKDSPRFPLTVKVNANDFTLTTERPMFGVPKGVKILSINGISYKEIVGSMLPYASGERDFYKLTRINNDFQAYFDMLYRSREYVIRYERGNKVVEREMRPVSYFEKKQEMHAQSLTQQQSEEDYYYRIINKNTAWMRLNNFVDQDAMAHFADSMIGDLRSRNIGNLIIDIRDNGGGNSLTADTLLRRLASRPFQQFSKVYARVTPVTQTMTRRPYPIGIFYDQVNDYIEPMPAEKRFNGKVWLLVSHHSFSTAASFAWTFKEFGMGTVVGEEAGGMNVAYGDVVTYKLPQSGIYLSVSFKRFWLHGADERNIHGAMPDIEVSSDNALDYTTSIITKR